MPIGAESRLNQFRVQLISAAAVGALSPVAVMATIGVLAAQRHPLRNAFALLCGWTALLTGLAPSCSGRWEAAASSATRPRPCST